MTYNVLSGTLSLYNTNTVLHCPVHAHWHRKQALSISAPTAWKQVVFKRLGKLLSDNMDQTSFKRDFSFLL